MSTNLPRIASLFLVAAVALPLVAQVTQAAPAAGRAGPAPALGDVDISTALTSLVSEQSIYLPCYAFVPVAGPRADWTPSRMSCYLMEKNKGIGLAAPLQIPVTKGKARVKALRCYAKVGTAGDTLEYSASVRSGNSALASLSVVKHDGDATEDSGQVNMDLRELEPATKHYDISVSWKVTVAPGDGWLPADHEFLGCRVDYTVMN